MPEVKAILGRVWNRAPVLVNFAALSLLLLEVPYISLLVVEARLSSADGMPPLPFEQFVNAVMVGPWWAWLWPPILAASLVLSLRVGSSPFLPSCAFLLISIAHAVLTLGGSTVMMDRVILVKGTHEGVFPLNLIPLFLSTGALLVAFHIRRADRT